MGGRHPAGSQSKWQEWQVEGAGPCVYFCVSLCAGASKWKQGSWGFTCSTHVLTGPPSANGPTPWAQPPPQSPHSTQQFLYSISGFNLVNVAPLCSRPWTDVWQLKDSHLLSLTLCQRSWEWPSLLQEVRSTENCEGFSSWLISILRLREKLYDVWVGSSGKYWYLPLLLKKQFFVHNFHRHGNKSVWDYFSYLFLYA